MRLVGLLVVLLAAPAAALGLSTGADCGSSGPVGAPGYEARSGRVTYRLDLAQAQAVFLEFFHHGPHDLPGAPSRSAGALVVERSDGAVVPLRTFHAGGALGLAAEGPGLHVLPGNPRAAACGGIATGLHLLLPGGRHHLVLVDGSDDGRSSTGFTLSGQSTLQEVGRGPVRILRESAYDCQVALRLRSPAGGATELTGCSTRYELAGPAYALLGRDRDRDEAHHAEWTGPDGAAHAIPRWAFHALDPGAWTLGIPTWRHPTERGETDWGFFGVLAEKE